jgi:hypothetical protein
MNKFLIIPLVLLNSIFSYSQSTSSIDVRYDKAIKYFQNNDSIKKEIKTRMSKKALKYEVQDTLINSNVHDFFETREPSRCLLSEAKLKAIDSVNTFAYYHAPRQIINGLNLFSTSSKSNYVISCSSITMNVLYLRFTLKPVIVLQDGSTDITNQSGIYMLFLFDESNEIKKVVWSYVFYEGGIILLSDKTHK